MSKEEENEAYIVRFLAERISCPPDCEIKFLGFKSHWTSDWTYPEMTATIRFRILDATEDGKYEMSQDEIIEFLNGLPGVE